MRLGKRLKAIRKERKITLKELSKKSGVQIATLSRMENDLMTGTLESHMAVCKALGVSLSDFYREIEEQSKKVHLSKKRERAESFVRSGKSAAEILVGKPMEKKLMPLLIKIKAGGRTHREANKIGSEKFIYVTEGVVSVRVGKEEYRLSKGDSIYFDAAQPHEFINKGNSEAAILAVSSTQK